MQQRLPWACEFEPGKARQTSHRAVVIGAGPVALQMMKVLGTNGIFVFTGVPGRKAPIEVDTDVIMRNLVLTNQVVFGTVNAGVEAFEATIRDVALFQERWPAAVRSLITGRYRVEAHRDLLVGPAQGIKNVLTFARVRRLARSLAQHRERASVDIVHRGFALSELSGDRESDERIGQRPGECARRSPGRELAQAPRPAQRL